MIGSRLRRLVDRLRAWWQPADPDERISGSGEVYLDPAYNGRYTAERRLQEAAEDEPPEEADYVGPHEESHVPPRRD